MLGESESTIKIKVCDKKMSVDAGALPKHNADSGRQHFSPAGWGGCSDMLHTARLRAVLWAAAATALAPAGPPAPVTAPETKQKVRYSNMTP